MSYHPNQATKNACTQERLTSFRFAIDPTVKQRIALAKHAGASRFAFNWGLATVKNALEASKKTPASKIKVPWTGYDFINAFNAWKKSPEAGITEDGTPGLPWRTEVSSLVFEEGVQDLGKALRAFSQSKKGLRQGKRVGFPRFKKKGRSFDRFRLRFYLRESSPKKPPSIRIGDKGPRSITLPRLGVLRLHNDTRKLRRLLHGGKSRILFATISRDAHRWMVSLNVRTTALHAAPAKEKRPLGIDRGLKTFAALAYSDGTSLDPLISPKPLTRHLRRLRRMSRAHSRKQKGSQNRRRQQYRLSRLHARIRHIRQDFMHRSTTALVKNHDHLVLEDLNVAGMIRNRCLARHIADAAWSDFARILNYKCAWYGRTLSMCGRFEPSSKRCSACQDVLKVLDLSQRTFTCPSCGFTADRDENAAINLAQWPARAWIKNHPSRAVETLAGTQPESLNACG